MSCLIHFYYNNVLFVDLKTNANTFGKKYPKYVVACQKRGYCFLLVNPASFLSPHKESASSKTGIGTCFQTTIVGFFSPAGFFSEPYINTRVLTYIICCHNNNTLYLQNTLK